MNKDVKFDNIRRAIFNWHKDNNRKIFNIKDPKVRLHEPTFGAEEISAFTEQLISTNVTMGKKVIDFEKKYCELMDFKFGVSNNSGSSANLLMLAAISNKDYYKRLNPGDEIIIPSLTWSTSVWPIVQYGMIPNFVDCDTSTLNLDTDLIIKAINSKTKAIMAVSIYGNPCNFDVLQDICKKYNLLLIEDSCESMGAKYRNKFVGSFGLISSFSFYFSHHITTLEGGMCVTKSEELAELMTIIRAHGWIRQIKHKKKYIEKFPDFDPKFLFVNEGYNLRITEPQASMGIIQLKKLFKFINSRKKNAQFFLKKLSKYENYLSFQKETKNGSHSWFGFIIIVRENSKFDRKQLCDYLNENGIETRVIVAGDLSKQPGMKLFPHKISGNQANSNLVMKNGFSIAVHQSLCDESKDYTVKIFDKFFKSKGIS